MTVGQPASIEDFDLVSGPLGALLELEREGLVVRVVEPPFDRGPQPAWRLTAEGFARSLALLQDTARHVARDLSAG